MKVRPMSSPQLQFNLPLAHPAVLELPADRSQELVHALVELLLGATQKGVAPNAAGGGQDESKADR
jgi:hypothetical protein